MVAALFLLLSLIWGATWLAIKIGLVGVPPFLGAGLRFLLSTFIVGVILVARGTRVRLSRDDTIAALSLGVFVFWIDYAAVYWAETRISSGLTAVLFSTMPLMTALLSAFWMRSESLSGSRLAGIVVGIVGTAVLFWPQERLGVQEALGMLATLAASLCAAINLVIVKRYGRHSDPYVLNVVGMSIGTVGLLGMSLALEDWSTVTWSLNNVLALLYLSVCGSVVAFSIYYHLIKRMDATTVSLSSLIIPVIALLLGRTFLDEAVTPTACAGMTTVLIGVGVALMPLSSRRV